MPRITLLLAMLLSSGLTFAQPPDKASPARGHLVIVGGGLAEDNALVHERILDLMGPDGRMGILPTASGVPEESGPGYVKDFQRYGGPGRARLIDLTIKHPDRAEDESIVRAIDECAGLFFTGGDQSRITAVFRPDGKRTAADQAVNRLLARGGVIAGSSAGAAMMSDPMLRWGRSSAALLIGKGQTDGHGVGIGPGMGFFPHGLTGQHFLRRGRMGRMVAALELAGRRLGFGLDNNGAIHVDLASGRIETLGPRALVLVDMGRAERKGFLRKGIRLSLLGGGDIIDGPAGKVWPAPGKVPMRARKDGQKRLPRLGDVWARDAIARLIEQLADHPATEVTGSDESFVLHLREDAETRFWIDRGRSLMTLTAIGVRLDIVPRKGAEKRAKGLLEKAREAANKKKASK